MRLLSASRLEARLGQSTPSGWAAATSSWVRNAASGLRSSWDALPTKSRSRFAASSSRPSISFIVRASRPISSFDGGVGTRRSSRWCEIEATSARMSSTGRSVRPTMSQVPAAKTATSRGSPMTKDRVSSRMTSRSSSRLVPTYAVTPSPRTAHTR